jgi:hypothetical protein
VQGFPSSHGFELFMWAQPVAGLHESVVHGLSSLQLGPGPPWQAPLSHVSPVVQAFPSLHMLTLLVWTHPVAGLHASSVHGFPSSQFCAGPPLHVPLPQVSPVVQTLPSSQGAVLFVKTHPVAGLQLSVVHTLASSQTTGVPTWQVPPPQCSPLVQALPSSHGFVLLECAQPVAGLQESFVQGLPSSQFMAEPWHAPPAHESPLVHALPSSHGARLFV